MNIPTIGFIGTGMIATAMIKGFCNRSSIKYPIVVSNRTKDSAKNLADAYPDYITYADSFQECVDKSDWVVLAVLPGAATDVLSSLEFKSTHNIVSVVFSMPAHKIAPLINCKVNSITHMIPGTFVSEVDGPILMSPSHKPTEEIFQNIGSIVTVESPDDEKILLSLTSLFAPMFSIHDTAISWCENKGIDSATAASYISPLFKALCEEACMTDRDGIHTLATVNTPGGINMQAVETISSLGGFKSFEASLDAIYKRICQ